MLSSVWNILDFAAFFPPLMEVALMHGANMPFSLGRFDLRWFKILRYVWPLKYKTPSHQHVLETMEPLL